MPYHQDMLNEMQKEVSEKKRELDRLSSSLQGFSVSEELLHQSNMICKR